MNPLGFALENFDAVGRYRDRDNAKEIDASGSFEANSGKMVKFAGAKELARFLAGSEEAHAAFVQRLETEFTP